MHRKTAIRRLRTIAELCDRASRPWDDRDPVLVGAYAFGTVLEPVTELPWIDVAFVLDLPTDELTWCTRPQSCLWLVAALQLDKTPVSWHWRPSAWPVWNHYIQRPLRFWSSDGSDDDALDALSSGDVEAFRLPTPSPAEEAAQIAVELDASLAHLHRVDEGFWERDWRRANKGSGSYPVTHLWNAVHGYLELLDAAQALRD